MQYRSLYPGKADTFINHGSKDGIGLDIDWQKSDELSSEELDLITDAILEIERVLGINPAGAYSSILAWLTALQADLDGFPNRLKNLLTAEIQQLENINLVTISNTQWGALGALVEWTDWIPTLTGDADLSGYTHARYYRIGKLCFFEFSAEAKNVTTSGVVQVTLPFTHANTGHTSITGNVNDGTNWVGYTAYVIDANVNYISIYKTAAAGSWAGTENGVIFRLQGFFEII